MEMASANNAEPGCFRQGWDWLKALPRRSWAKLVEMPRKIKKLGQDDPRRVVHSLKVGLAITLVSLFYCFEPLFGGFGVSAMWAVLTVVVVFEFSVGATLGRGLNRGLATLVAGALGVAAHYVASLSGEKGQPILLSLFVFLLAATVTFLRFIPRLKARYDYGLIIFILTFCLISVSGYRDDEVLVMAHQRLSTILIGGGTAVIVSVCICPVWAGNELHDMVANNMEKLGNFLEGFGDEYFKRSLEGKSKDKNTVLQEYKSVLNSKNSEENLVNYARWEPRHGQFKFRHPWKQYSKIGSLTRQCAYRIEALNNYLNSDVQAPLEVRAKIQESCTTMSLESGKALKELSASVKTMSFPSLASSTHIANSKAAAKSLKSSFKTSLWEDADLLEVAPAATVASLLIDLVSSTETIAESVQELASLARFKAIDAAEGATDQRQKLHGCQRRVRPCSNGSAHHVITIE